MNKIPVLDIGYVAFYSTSINRDKFIELKTRYFKGKLDKRLTNMTQVHLEIKCPIFVQLTLTESSLTSASLPTGKVEAYVPTIAEVAAKDLNTSQEIQTSIEGTTNALLLNPKSYQMDGCDLFIAQVNYPLSVYNTIIVSGSLSQWLDYINREGLPTPIEQYRKAIEAAILAEWDMTWELVNGKKNQDRVKK